MGPINIGRWIEEHRELLLPPVCNKSIYQGDDFIVMIVGGPNERQDYHINDGEELFYQLSGAMVLKIVDETASPAVFKDVRIEEGEMYLLPRRVPHSPQRPPNTVGLVFEIVRNAADGLAHDTLCWYCPACRSVLYSESFICDDIDTQVAGIIARFDASMRCCVHCKAAA